MAKCISSERLPFRFFTSLKNNMSKIIYYISLFTIYKVSIHIFSPIQSDVCIFQENLEILLEICLKRPGVGRDRDSQRFYAVPVIKSLVKISFCEKCIV